MTAMDEKLLAQYIRSLHERKMKFWYRHLLKNQLRPFLRWLSDQRLPLAQLTPEQVLAYLQDRQRPGIKPLTLRMALHALRDFLRRFAIPRQLIDHDPTPDITAADLALSKQLIAYQGPLRTLFKEPLNFRKYELPLFAPFWEPYLEHLFHQHYPKRSIWAKCERLFYFHQFLLTQKVTSVSQITPRRLTAFVRHYARAFRHRRGRAMRTRYRRHVQAFLENFLRFAATLEERSFPPQRPAPDSRVLPNALLDRYDDYCRIHRGLAPATRWVYHNTLLKLRIFLAHRRVHRLRDITALHLDDFLFRLAQKAAPKTLHYAATALRSFFGYLYVEGRLKKPLHEGLLSPSLFRDDRRPKYIPWSLVLKLLASVNRTSRVGKRDYALLSLLAYHGLRGHEAAQLRVSDIDWPNHAFTLQQRKTGESARLPLAPAAEEALREYLAVRSQSSALEIFLTEQAPMKALSRGGVSGVAQRHLHRLISKPAFPLGAYTLRHSFAKAMLDRGATLFEVGSVLGHKNLRSTLIYTRIHTNELREVADNYAAFFAPEP